MIPADPQSTWSAVDNLLDTKLHFSDPILTSVLAASDAAGLPQIAVSPAQGKFLYLLARIRNATRVLEVGTLAGYSTIWLARALPPQGKVVTLELDAKHARVARANFTHAGVSEKIELIEGPATDSLAKLASAKTEPFDLTFIDADKANSAVYFDWALKLSHPGSVIILDNVIRRGAILTNDLQHTDPNNQGTLEALTHMGNDTVSATALQTVSIKGYDGFSIAVVN